ncbi:MAG: hypothetical protein GY863_22245 [bacterium]|nr:hypothetical protein [bacterium]
MDIKWSDDFRTGIHILDSQTRNFITRLSKLTKAVDNGRGKIEVDHLIEFLEEYTDSHFKLEEKLMRKLHYPEAAFHYQEHNEFKTTFIKLKREFTNGSFSSDSIKYFQYEVWTFYKEHISVIDAQMARFLRGKMGE